MRDIDTLFKIISVILDIDVVRYTRNGSEIEIIKYNLFSGLIEMSPSCIKFYEGNILIDTLYDSMCDKLRKLGLYTINNEDEYYNNISLNTDMISRFDDMTYDEISLILRLS